MNGEGHLNSATGFTLRRYLTFAGMGFDTYSQGWADGPEFVYGDNGDSTFNGTIYAQSGGHGTMYLFVNQFYSRLLVGGHSVPDGDERN